MSDDNTEFSFFCQYDDCGSRAPNIHELRVAIVSVEVPSDNEVAEDGFVRYSAIYGTTGLTTPACSVQSNFRVKYISTSTECALLIGDEGIWNEAYDLLTGQNITPLPPWSEEDRKLFDEVCCRVHETIVRWVLCICVYYMHTSYKITLIVDDYCV